MSVSLMTSVWASALTSDLKFMALCLADFGDDEGNNIFPSVDYIAWKTGYSPRSVQRILKRLTDIHILEVVKNGTGGRGKTTEYRMNDGGLPGRKHFHGRTPNKVRNRNPDKMSGFKKALNPDIHDTETPTSTTSNASDPSCTDPLVEPSGNVRSLRDQVPEPGKVFLKAHHPPKRVKVDPKHTKHVFCGESQCVDRQKHERFLLRIKVAGADLDEAGLQRFYKSVDTDYVKGAFGETPDHPALILEREFQEEIKD